MRFKRGFDFHLSSRKKRSGQQGSRAPVHEGQAQEGEHFSLWAYVVGSDAILDVLGKLLLERLLVLILQALHVLSHVLPEDTVAVHLGTELL